MIAEQHGGADDADDDGVAMGKDLREDEAADEDGAQRQPEECAHALPTSNGDDDHGEECRDDGEGHQPDVIGDLEERIAVWLLRDHHQRAFPGAEADGVQRWPHPVVGKGGACAPICAFGCDFHIQPLRDHDQTVFVGEGFLFEDVDDAGLHGFFEVGDLLIVLDRRSRDVQGDEDWRRGLPGRVRLCLPG